MKRIFKIVLLTLISGQIIFAPLHLFADDNYVRSVNNSSSDSIDLLKAKAALKESTLERLRNINVKLSDYFAQRGKPDLEILSAVLIVWDRILRQNGLLPGDNEAAMQTLEAHSYKVERPEDSEPTSPILTILSSISSSLKSETYWPFNYTDEIIAFEPAFYVQKVLLARLKERVKAEDGYKAEKLFTLSQKKEADDLIDYVYKLVLNPEEQEKLVKEISGLKSIFTNGQSGYTRVKPDDLSSYQEIKHKVIFAVLSLRLFHLKLASHYTQKPEFSTKPQEERIYKKLRKIRIEQAIFLGEERSIFPDEEKFYNSRKNILEKAFRLYELKLLHDNPLASSQIADKELLNKLKKYDDVNKLIEMERSGRIGMDKRLSLEGEAIEIYHALRYKLFKDSLERITLILAAPSRHVDVTGRDKLREKLMLSLFTEEVSVSLKEIATNKIIGQESLNEYIYDLSYEIRPGEYFLIAKYFYRVVVASDYIDIEKNDQDKAAISGRLDDLSPLLYQNIRQKMKSTTSQKIVSEINSSEKIQDQRKTELTDAIKAAKSPSTGIHAANELMESNPPDSASSARIRYDLGYKNPHEHNFFNCDRLTCPYMLMRKDFDDISMASSLGPAYPLYWLLDKSGMINLVWPYKNTGIENYWLDTHPVDDSELKILAEVNDEILNTVRDGYEALRELVYFSDKAKEELVSLELFDKYDNNKFIMGDTSDLIEIATDDSTLSMALKSYKNFFSYFRDGFKKIDETARKMGIEKDVKFKINVVPNENELFSKYPFDNNHYRLYKPESTLLYPKVLDKLTHPEKRILFENFLVLYLIDGERANIEAEKRLEVFSENLNSTFNDLIKINRLGEYDAIKLAALLLPYTPITRDSSPDKNEVLDGFYYSKLQETPEKIYAANRYTFSELRRKKTIDRLNLRAKQIFPIIYTPEKIEHGIKLIKPITTDYIKRFKARFGKTWDEALKEKSEIPFMSYVKTTLESDEFLDWFKSNYKVDFDLELYNDLRTEYSEIKANYIAKLYIEYQIERAREELSPDGRFDLLDYIQKRTHLRLLTNIAVMRMEFMKRFKPFQYETFKVSDFVLADSERFAKELAALFLIINPAFKLIGTPVFKMMGNYITRPILASILRRTLPVISKSDGFISKLWKHPILGFFKLGNYFSATEFAAGRTIRSGIMNGKNSAFKRLTWRFATKEEARVLEFGGTDKTYAWNMARKSSVAEYQTNLEARRLAEAGNPFTKEQRKKFYRERMEELAEINAIKAETIKVDGNAAIESYVMNQSWLKNLYLKFTESDEGRKYLLDRARELGGAVVKSTEKERIEAVMNMDLHMFTHLRKVTIDDMPAYLSAHVTKGETALQLIPVNKSNISWLLNDKFPLMPVHLFNQEWTVLDFRSLTPETLELLKKFFLQSFKSRGGNVEEFELSYEMMRYFKEILSPKILKYFRTMGIEIDAMITIEEGSMVFSMISGKYRSDLFNMIFGKPTIVVPPEGFPKPEFLENLIPY